MKLSIETKVASVVAAGFLAVTIGVVAQANGAAEASGSDNHRLAKDRANNTYMIQQGKDVDGAPGVSDL